MKIKILLLVLSSGLIAACSSSQKNPDFSEYLATNIRSDGSKEFYYTVTFSNGSGSKRGMGKYVQGGMRVSGGSSSNTSGSGGITVSNSGGGGGGGYQGNRSSRRGQGGKGGSQPDERISEQLEKKLLASGYCRDGWMETERHIQAPNASIRGECNETATDRDLENFPNSEDISG